MIWTVILSLLGGGGITATGITVWGKLKAKSMDIAFEERKQFVKELNDMRNELNGVYKKLNEVVRESGELRLKLKELDDQLTKKADVVKRLHDLVEEYKARHNEEQFINKIIELAS